MQTIPFNRPASRRRLLYILLALLLLTVTAACTKDETNTTGGEPSAQEKPADHTGTAGRANADVPAEQAGQQENVDGEEKPQPQNDGTPQSVTLVPVPVSGLEGTSYGYLDEQGRMAIPARFSYAGPFDAAGWAQAYAGSGEDELQLIGRDGKAWFTSRNASVIGSEDEVVAVMAGDRYLLLKAGTGERLLDTAGELSAPKNGRIRFANVATNGTRTYGYLDLSGKVVIEPRYAAADDFNEGKAVVKRGDADYALIDENGKTLTEFAEGTNLVTGYGDGLVVFKTSEDGPYGYADEKGDVVIPPRFFSAEPFKDGVAIVSEGTGDAWKYGLVDWKGLAVVEPAYDYLFRTGDLFHYGKVSEDEVNPLYAAGDAKGRLAGPFEYESIADDGAGHIYATDGVKTYFLKEDGTRNLSLPVFEGAATVRLEGDIVSAAEYGRVRVVTGEGKEIWRESRSYKVTDSIAVEEQTDRMPPNKYIYYPKLVGLSSEEAEHSVNEAIRQEAATSMDYYRNPDEEQSPEDAKWADRTELSGDYEIAGVKGDLLVLMLSGYEYSRGAAHGNPWTTYMNIDLRTGAVYRLEDLIPDPRGQRAVTNLLIKRMKADTDNEYWLDDYEGVDGDASFYIRDDSLVLYFNPYEIAPYAAGFPEFAIPFTEIGKWIDKNGAFWKAMQ